MAVKAHRVREMSADEIRSRILELRESQFKLKFRNAMKRLDNPLELRNVRREIAVLNTVLNEHESGIRNLGTKSAKREDSE